MKLLLVGLLLFATNAHAVETYVTVNGVKYHSDWEEKIYSFKMDKPSDEDKCIDKKRRLQNEGADKIIVKVVDNYCYVVTYDKVTWVNYPIEDTPENYISYSN